MNKDIAEAVLQRAGNYCEACGLPCSDFALHHRRLKSQGGKDEVCNLIAVHHMCHNLGTHSIHMRPKKAIDRGQICPSWAEPSEFPLMLSDDSKVLLDNEGNYIYLKEGSDGADRGCW